MKRQLSVLLIDEFGGWLSREMKDKTNNMKVDLHYSSREAFSTINPKDYDMAIIDLKSHLENLNSGKSIAEYLKENKPEIINILKGYEDNLISLFNCDKYYDLELNFLKEEDNVSKIKKILIKKGLLSKIQ